MLNAYQTVPFKHNPGSYRIRLATAADYAAILSVQNEVLDVLSAEHRRYVFRRRDDHIQNVLNFAGHVLLAEDARGIFATMLLMDVADTVGYLRALDMDTESYVPLSFASGGIVMQSLLVRPQYHGQGIAQQMFAAAVDVARENGVGFIAMAENRANKPAISAAFRNMFAISGFGTHSAYGVPGYIFCKDMVSEAMPVGAEMQADDEDGLNALVLALVANSNQITAVNFQTNTVSYRAAGYGIVAA